MRGVARDTNSIKSAKPGN